MIMAKSIGDIPNNRDRPKTVGHGEDVTIRLQAVAIDEIEAWAKKQDDQPSRAEATRRLLEGALTNERLARRTNPKSASKATAMAGETLDGQVDASATPDEQAKRKRRLLMGPAEFRDMRRDHRKKKET